MVTTSGHYRWSLVLPSVAENWGHWWMQTTIWAFGLACAICVFGFLHGEAELRRVSTALAPSFLLFVIFASVMLVSYAGGTMPAFLLQLKDAVYSPDCAVGSRGRFVV